MEDQKPFAVSNPSPDLALFELFGGDNNLSHFVQADMEEMAAGITGNITVLGLADYANKPACVIEISKGTGIVQLEQWGEIDTGDPDVLKRFLVRAWRTYPNTRKAIGFWDHGTGVFDETDASEKILARRMSSVAREDRSRSYAARRLFFPKDRLKREPGTRAMLHDDTNGGVLTNLEASAMLASVFNAVGQAEPIDLLFSDTCLNGMIEVATQLGPYARCIVASPELEPGDGWDYSRWMSLLSKEPPATPYDWGRLAVQAFNDGYAGSPGKYPCTLAAFKTDNHIVDAFADLINSARRGGRGYDTMFFLDHARAKSQGFAKRDTYDLRNFGERVAGIASDNKDLANAATALIAAIDAANVQNCCLGPTVSDSHGLAFWFPSSHSALARDMGTYERLEFAKKTGWSEFLKEFR